MTSNPEPACRCPFCDEPLADESRICRPCSVKFVACKQCGKQFAETAERCPECGEPRRARKANQ